MRMIKRMMMVAAMAAGLAGCKEAFDPQSIPDASREEVTRVEPLC